LLVNYYNKYEQLFSKSKKIFETLKQFESKVNFKNQIRQSKMSGLELLAIDLTAEYMNVDSERQLFRILPNEITTHT
jgi:hypothetical protein